MARNIFISHASQDKGFAESLRKALQECGVEAWIDHRELLPGDTLAEEIRAAIEKAEVFVTVWTLAALNSPWVGTETRWAMAAQAQKPGYTLLPLLLGGEIQPKATQWFYGRELLCIPVTRDAGGLQEAMARILEGLGLRLPTLVAALTPPAPPAMEELVLVLSMPSMVEEGGTRRGRAQAEVQYHPADGRRHLESRPFPFEAPAIEMKDLSWYLEQFPRWPGQAFRPRAQKVEKQLPLWGQALFNTTLARPEVATVRHAWQNAPDGHQRRLTIQMKHSEGEGAWAAAHLLSLPWETLHDGRRYLFEGRTGVRVRRRLPNFNPAKPLFTRPPLRVLLLCPRPADQGYIDHRVTALPMVEALAALGDLARLTVLEKPTFSGLVEALRLAEERGEPFHVVHFDGHGVYLRDRGLGALCFEQEEQKLAKTSSHTVGADELAARLTDFRIPLFFLEACQSGQAELDASSSVAAQLLDRGVAAVAAMSHSVLVVTAREFVTVFYQALARGARVGEAMLAGQRRLHEHKTRGHYLGAGQLLLEDWFVPLLFQEGEDFPLVEQVPGQQAQELARQRHQALLGELPDPPTHHFVGRSREMLALERLLLTHAYGVVVGEGGEGKTELACEVARWLLAIHRVERVAFVSTEEHPHHAAILERLIRQLVGRDHNMASFPDVDQAMQAVERALRERPTLLVLDNLETILPPQAGGQAPAYDEQELANIFGLLQRLMRVGQTRLLFTSRESLPAPFQGQHLRLDRLEEWDGVELVKNVLQQAGVTPHQQGDSDQEETLLALVNAVHGHARTLVLLAPELARQGITPTTASLHQLMADLEKEYPGQRLRSLYAGVALSLHRLSPTVRQAVRPLGVLQGGGHVEVMAHVLGMEDPQQVGALVVELFKTGLCQVHHKSYLTFHFALCPFLWGEMDEDTREQTRQRWLAGEEMFVGFLYEQQFKDAWLAAALTLLDLANLLAGLEAAARTWPAERTMDWATKLAGLLQNIGHKTAREKVARLRQELESRLGKGWSHVRFIAERAHIEELAARGLQRKALEAASQLLQRCRAAGEDAYPGAGYDVAVACILVGRYSQMAGQAAGALPLLQESRKRFLVLAGGGNQSAHRMAAAVLNESGDCHKDLGHLEEAARCYQESGREDEQVGNARGVAVSQMQLGTVRLLQKRYPEALTAYEQARETFAKLQDPVSLAAVWHQTGRVYQEMAAWPQAEEAYRHALEIKTKLGNQPDVASSLNQLGRLFDGYNRWEEAVVQYRNAASIYVDVGNLAMEGLVRNNLAISLGKLDRLEEARQEIKRAIKCKKPFGHAANPWTSWQNLADIETAAGQPQAAAQALQQARLLFAQYRRDGGENHETGGRWCQNVMTAIQQGAGDQAMGELAAIVKDPKIDPRGQTLAQVLLAILAGQRQPALAWTEGLFYRDAVEVELLLEQLGRLPAT